MESNKENNKMKRESKVDDENRNTKYINLDVIGDIQTDDIPLHQRENQNKN